MDAIAFCLYFLEKLTRRGNTSQPLAFISWIKGGTISLTKDKGRGFFVVYSLMDQDMILRDVVIGRPKPSAYILKSPFWQLKMWMDFYTYQLTGWHLSCLAVRNHSWLVSQRVIFSVFSDEMFLLEFYTSVSRTF